MKSILFIWAHNDDAEIFAGGTLIQHKNSGYSVHIWVLDHADGIRKLEQKNKDDYLKAKILYFKSVSDIEKHLLKLKPEIIITHWDRDSHPDHRKVSWMALDAIKSLKILHSLPKRLFYCTTYNNVWINLEFSPNVYINISDVSELKKLIIRKFISQNPEFWIFKAEVITWLFWSRCDCKHAEGFQEVFFLCSFPTRKLLE